MVVGTGINFHKVNFSLSILFITHHIMHVARALFKKIVAIFDSKLFLSPAQMIAIDKTGNFSRSFSNNLNLLQEQSYFFIFVLKFFST